MAEPLDVVVVDDMADAAQAMAEFLRMDGYHAAVATSGEEAMALIRDQRPLGVLIDVDMPGMNGFELAQHLREAYGGRLLLVAFSGLGDDSALVMKTLKVVDDYLRKPVSADRLRKLFPPIRR